MTAEDFSNRLVVDRTPEQVFEAICNLRGWWSENIDGPTHELGAMFDYRYCDVHQARRWAAQKQSLQQQPIGHTLHA